MSPLNKAGRYEMRRQCQEILPGVLLGPMQASKSLETLQSFGVTHMYVPLYDCRCHDFEPQFVRVALRRICIRDQQEAFSIRPRFPDNFVYLVLDVKDNEEQNLIRLFPQYVLSVVMHFIRSLIAV